MAELPSGTVTLLFTDIEGSTRLLQELWDDYAELAQPCRADRTVRSRTDLGSLAVARRRRPLCSSRANHALRPPAGPLCSRLHRGGATRQGCRSGHPFRLTRRADRNASLIVQTSGEQPTGHVTQFVLRIAQPSRHG
jgi:hypothetical protein